MPGSLNITTKAENDPFNSADNTEIKLNYPANQRLLLGTLNNLSAPGFHKAMQSEYPVELSIEVHDLCGSRLRGLLGRRAKFPCDIHPFAVFLFKSNNGPGVSSSFSSSSDGNAGEGAVWQPIGRTETILYDDYIRFVAKVKLVVPTTHDRLREIRVELFNQLNGTGMLKNQQFLGAINCSVESIVSEPLFRKEVPMKTSRDLEACSMILSADIIRPSIAPSKVTLNVDFSSITKGAAKCFYVMSRQLPSGDFTPVYRSEILDSDQKKFASMTRLVDALTAGVDDKLLKLEFYQVTKSRKNQCAKLGFLQTSLKKMKEMKWNSSLLWWPAMNEANHPDFVEVGRVVMLENEIADDHCRFLLRVTS